MKLLIYLLGIIGSVGSLVYSFNFSSNNHFIFISCISRFVNIFGI